MVSNAGVVREEVATIQLWLSPNTDTSTDRRSADTLTPYVT